MKLYIIGITCLLTLGCVPSGTTLPGEIKFYKSKTDNIAHVEAEPGWVDLKFRMGLHWTSSLSGNTVILTLLTKNTVDSLTINIDGIVYNISPIDKLSDVNQYNEFAKRFLVKTKMIRDMVVAKEVWVKVSFIGQSYVEGDFTKDVPYNAKSGFVKFIKKIDEPKP